MTKDWEGFESPHEHKVPVEALGQPTRLEVIDADGRTYTNWKVKELQLRRYKMILHQMRMLNGKPLWDGRIERALCVK